MASTQSQVKPLETVSEKSSTRHTSRVFNHHFFYEIRLNEIPMGESLQCLSEGLGEGKTVGSLCGLLLASDLLGSTFLCQDFQVCS